MFIKLTGEWACLKIDYLKRNFRLEVPFIRDEVEKVKRKSESYGMTASAFARLILLNSQIKEIEVELNNKKV